MKTKEVPDTAPEGYEMIKDSELEMDFLVDSKTCVKVATKPVMIRYEAETEYGMFFFYCSAKGVDMVKAGKLPPRLPVSWKTPEQFETIEAVVKNFVVKENADIDPTKVGYCIPMMVPKPMMARIPSEDQDIWIIDFTRRRQVKESALDAFVAQAVKEKKSS